MGDGVLSQEIAIGYGTTEKSGLYAVVTAVNAVMAAGAKSVGARVRIECPEGTEKARIYGMMKPIRAFCRGEGITLIEDGIQISPAVSRAVTVAAAAGVKERDKEVKEPGPGQDILLTRWVGLGGTVQALWERREELEKRFPPGFLRQAGEMEAGLFAGREAALAWERGASYVQAVGEGGVKAALWEMAKVLECGVDVNLKALPIRQETVEICEYLGLNPYQLSSTGSLLITAPEGEALAGELSAAGIPAAVVGTLTDNNDKILRSGEEVQYLDRPAPDEIRKIYT